MLYMERHYFKFHDLFLKGKQEDDSFPDTSKTREEKELYIRNYFEREGIILEIDKIAYNKGLRSVMKVLQNSFCGRFVRHDLNTESPLKDDISETQVESI
ncbi:unnamed protein product, partial [Brachionus calyciflorus]